MWGAYGTLVPSPRMEPTSFPAARISVFKTKFIFWIFILACVVNGVAAREVVIADSGLTAAIREALQKPIGPWTAQDLLELTNLDASNRQISSVAGLEGARNLATLKLFHNNLSRFSVPSELTHLTALDLSFNALTNFSIPDEVTPPAMLNLADNSLVDLFFPLNLSGLTNLNIEDNGFTFFKLPSFMTKMAMLDGGFNSITNLVVPNGITNLQILVAAGNLLPNIVLPVAIEHLESLDLHTEP